MSLAIDENGQASSAHDQHGDPLILTDPDGQFARNYNRQPFAFPHGLKDHPLLELPNLIELAKRPFHHEPYWSTAQIKVNDSWGTGEFTGLSLTDTIANIGETNSIVLLKHVEQIRSMVPCYRISWRESSNSRASKCVKRPWLARDRF